jgi:hypothetical protein
MTHRHWKDGIGQSPFLLAGFTFVLPTLVWDQNHSSYKHCLIAQTYALKSIICSKLVCPL